MKINFIHHIETSDTQIKYLLVEGDLTFNHEEGTLKFTTKMALAESFELKFARMIEVSETIMSFSGVKKVGMSLDTVLVGFTTVGL